MESELPVAPDPWVLQTPTGVAQPATAKPPSRAQELSDRMAEGLRWRRDSAIAAAKVAGAGLAIAILAGVALSTTIDLALGEARYSGNPIDWFRGGAALVALATGGAASLTPAGDANEAISFAAAPLVLTFLIFGSTFWVARRYSRSLGPGPRKRVGQIAVGAATVGTTVLTVLLLVSGGEYAPGLGSDTVEIHAVSWSGALGAWLLMGLSSFLGALDSEARRAGAPGWRAHLPLAVRGGIAHALSQVAVLAVAGVVAVAVVYLVEYDGEIGHLATPEFWIALLLAVPTVALGASALMSGTTLTQGATYEVVMGPESGVLVGGAPGELLLGLVGVGTLSVFVGIRSALREPDRTATFAGAWVPGAAAVAMWLCVHQIAEVRTGLPFEDASDGLFPAPYADLRLGLASAVVTGTLWTLFGLVAGRVLARPFAASFPRVTRILAGRGIDESWRSLVGDRIQHRRRPRESTLGVGAPYLTLVVALSIAVLALVLLPSDGLEGCGNAVSASTKQDRPVPSEEPPADKRTDWARQEAEIKDAEAAANSAAAQARPIQEAGAEMVRLTGVSGTISDELQTQYSTISERESEVEDARSSVEVAQEEVDVAQQDYDDFSEFDFDNFWLDLLNEAQAELGDAQGQLDKAEQQLDQARAAAQSNEARLDDLQSRISRIQGRVDANAAVLARSDAARERLDELADQLVDDKQEWAESNAAARTEAVAYNESASACRTAGTTRLVPAAIGLLLLLVTALRGGATRARRARRTRA